ncbi:MAG: primosomal protein N' [Desulfobacterota bacterium]|nr:primosomal protein N' [Thermodesulfobacteriota bacterium]
METDETKTTVRVAVTLPVEEAYTYRVPSELEAMAKVGCRVEAPFGKRKVTGYILEHAVPEEDRDLKEIVRVLDPEPLFHPSLVPFFQWMSEYYLFPLGRLIQSALPGGLNIRSYRLAVLTAKGEDALQFLPSRSEEKKLLAWLRDHPAKRAPFPLDRLNGFEKRGWVTLEQRTTKKRGGPLVKRFVRPKEGVALKDLAGQDPRGLKAKNETAFLEAVFSSNGVLSEELNARFTNGAALVRKWLKRGILETYEAAVVRDPAGNVILPNPPPKALYAQQKETLEAVKKQLARGTFSTFLLHGVTGSGKTEVYYQAVRQVMDLGRQAILLVPEIALAVYTEGLLRARLGDRLAVYHSGLSEGERYDQWMKMARGDAAVVIGARSALFAPFPNLGLVIVDEEHDPAYKQEEGARYQARDAAVVRGKLANAPVLLGSGTPSVQSYYNAARGRYTLLRMPERIEQRPLPEVQVIDMKAFTSEGKDEAILSPVLRAGLEEAVGSGKQAILFLNRRGFHRVHLCRACGKPVRCPNCEVSLIYHLRENRLACHYCGYHSPPQTLCPACGREGLRSYGFGTERLETELKELYPRLRLARMDRDNIRRKGHTFEMLRQFTRREIDVLVGTQMVTKGYDFPSVTLVGVIGADFSLGFPDFRAGERTFQILSQVAGRAGRGEDLGRVLIQTFYPDHYVVTTARDHDYLTFFQKEIELREQLGYPPFSSLACLRLQGNHKQKTEDLARRVVDRMIQTTGTWPKRGKDLQVLGPVEAPLSKLKGKYRWQVFIRSKGHNVLHVFLKAVGESLKKMLRGSGVSLTVDIDPYQML